MSNAKTRWSAAQCRCLVEHAWYKSWAHEPVFFEDICFFVLVYRADVAAEPYPPELVAFMAKVRRALEQHPRFVESPPGEDMWVLQEEDDPEG